MKNGDHHPTIGLLSLPSNMDYGNQEIDFELGILQSLEKIKILEDILGKAETSGSNPFRGRYLSRGKEIERSPEIKSRGRVIERSPDPIQSFDIGGWRRVYPGGEITVPMPKIPDRRKYIPMPNPRSKILEDIIEIYKKENRGSSD